MQLLALSVQHPRRKRKELTDAANSMVLAGKYGREEQYEDATAALLMTLK